MKSFWKSKKINNFIFNNYDHFVNNLNCKYVWKCDERYVKKLYANNITNNHLEIGPGTGYFLKKYTFQNLHLIDVNQDILDNSKKNLNSNCKNLKIYNKNIFKNNNRFNENISSIGLSYVLHCIPDNLDISLDTLIKNISQNNQITIFGATVIPNKNDLLAMTEIFTLNKFGIFSNINHNKDQLEYIVNKYKGNIKQKGNVLLFNFNLY